MTEKYWSCFFEPVSFVQFAIGTDSFKGNYVLEKSHKVIKRHPLYQFDTNPVSAIKKMRQLTAQFASYSHLHIPNMDIVQAELGSTKSFKPYLLVIDRIKGKALPVANIGPEHQKVLESFLISLLDYTQDVYLRGGAYLSDQKPEQYVLSTPEFEQDCCSKVYLVDLDFHFGHVDKQHPLAKTNQNFFYELPGFIAMRIVDFEERLGMSLSNVRTAFFNFSEMILASGDPYQSIVEEQIKFLDHHN